MAAHAALEAQAHNQAKHCNSKEIGFVEPMRLVLGKEASTKPIHCVQYWVPDQDIAHPIGHHPWNIENSRTKIQNAGQLRPDLVPGFEEGIEDGVNETEPAPQQPYGDYRSRDGRK